MSHDLLVWHGPSAGAAAEEDVHAALTAGGPVDERSRPHVLAFLLTAQERWPGEGAALATSPWASWPLTAGMSGPGVVLHLQQGAPELREVVRSALSHRLVVHDPQTGHTLRPPRTPVAAPRWERLRVPLAVLLAAPLPWLLSRCSAALGS